MPLIYRSMRADGNKPQIGLNAKTLGVRVPDDIETDAQGNVHPFTGGMSVVPAWQLLMRHRIPRRLRNEVAGATGSNDLFCWRMGDGQFIAGTLTETLSFRPDPTNPARHGLVELAKDMLLDEYREAITATQDQWVIDET